MDNETKFKYCLRLADTLLIHGQRLSEWCGHGPVLEEDIALSNIALDYMGQASFLLKHAAQMEGRGRDEDQLAFLRDAHEFSNLLIVELPNGDYANTIARQFLFSTWYQLLLLRLCQSHDEFLQGFAEKSIKEVRYHVQHATDWVKRMGDGTAESHDRIQDAMNRLWLYTGEFFEWDTVDAQIIPETSPDNTNSPMLKNDWTKAVAEVLAEATIDIPLAQPVHTGGRRGKHTEHLETLLEVMQSMQRTYPGASW